MFLNLCQTSEGVFKKEYRKQLLAALSVTLITFGHGIILGWLSPMLIKLQSNEQSPLSFAITLEEASWVGSLICVGGLIGNITFGFLLDRIGRKTCLYCLAVPHVCVWFLIYFARSVEYLYVSRICAGTTGGGCYVVLPIFIGEISDSKIRGRLTSLFSLTLNTGILFGYIVSTHVAYYLIPCVAIALPITYLLLATYFPETPTYLLRNGASENAFASFKFYQNYDNAVSKNEMQRIENEFSELMAAVAAQQTNVAENSQTSVKDFFSIFYYYLLILTIVNKPALKALCSGLLLMVVNVFSGTFALIFYMSSVFAAAKVELHADTNTIIIGAVQIVGTYCAILLVDRCGRKLLLILSTAGMGIGLALFGMYGFVAEETAIDLTVYSRWLPLLIMSVTIFSANIGIIPVTFVLLVEIMPTKIRSRAASFCLAFLSIFGFCSVKTFPIFMHIFGLSATMWMCASVCAFGLFYISVAIKETNGKSLNKDETL